MTLNVFEDACQGAYRNIRMAVDALKRADDGVDSGNWDYIETQLQKAKIYIDNARYEADRAGLLETKVR